MLVSSCVLLAALTARPQPTQPPNKSWDVKLVNGGSSHTLKIPEGQSVLQAAELAGLLPGSDCQRGRCLSCAARVLGGSKFSLAVDADTALCEEAHVDGIVLLCSAFPRGYASNTPRRSSATATAPHRTRSCLFAQARFGARAGCGRRCVGNPVRASISARLAASATERAARAHDTLPLARRPHRPSGAVHAEPRVALARY